ncbi:MAG: haloalkane dehalogenase [Deltaproteobacteria bacterium]|nr:haloalkane dehalogenase [Deltaproteobacteria bacterium]
MSAGAAVVALAVAVAAGAPAEPKPELAWPGHAYVAQTVQVSGHPMRYVEAGSGDPILMLHGTPTQGYLWRNVVGGVADHGRVIVPDLMGFGKSYQGPEIGYDARSQQAHFDAFMDAMDLRDITLVVNDVGSMLGLHWASRHPDRVKGIVLVEAAMLDARSWWKHLPLGMKMSIRLMKNPRRAKKFIVDRNVMIEKSLGGFGVRRELSEEELDVYRAPFADPEMRTRVLLPLGPAAASIRGRSESAWDSAGMVNAYADWLRDTEIPKLLLHATPGLIAGRSAVRQAEKTFTNLESVSLGRGKHFLPEDHPDAIAEAIVKFVGRI